MEKVKVPKKAVQNYLWAKGRLEWLLFPHQMPIYKAIRGAMDEGKLKYVLNCSRRFGKTSVLVLIALETAMRDSMRQIRFASQTAKELRKAVHPIMQIFLQTCPEELKPRWNSQDQSYKFPNGSEIHIAGVNNGHEDDLRGSNSHLNIVDEAGMVDQLKYLVNSVLIPQTLTTNAITILASTPATSPDHDFKHYYDEAEVGGFLSEFNVYDNSSLTPEKIQQIKDDLGGDNSTDWQREYLIKWVVSEDLDIIPEWNDEYIKMVDTDEFYSMYHKYTVMDLGVMDKTAILYGYYDFRKAQLIVQAEDTINGYDMTTEKVSKLVYDREAKLWGQNPKVYKRVADNNNPLMLQDLSSVYGLYFMPTLKDSLDAMVNEVRLFVAAGRLIVHPNCHQLIGCLRYAIWDRASGNKRQFARSTAYGHYDALASLVYMIRNLDQNTNPIPATHNMTAHDFHINQQFGEQSTDDVEALKRAFKVRG